VRAFPQAAFHIPDVCLGDAQTLLPVICAKRNLNAARFQRILTELEVILIPVSRGLYEPYEDQALSRIRQRDPDDWPVVAAALALDLPIWTEDRDFFGCGIATWITNTVEIYLRAES
jgi:predicted nucleic acid-binding protein